MTGPNGGTMIGANRSAMIDGPEWGHDGCREWRGDDGPEWGHDGWRDWGRYDWQSSGGWLQCSQGEKEKDKDKNYYGEKSPQF